MHRLNPLALAALFVSSCALVQRDEGTVQIAWLTFTSGTEVSLRGISAVDENTAWASGAEGTWLRTIDGGSTWSKGVVPGAEELDFRDVHAFSADRAVLISAGEPALFVTTEDGGATWTTRHSDPTPGVFFDAADFWNDTHGLAFSDPLDGRIHVLSTSDGAHSWERVESAPEALAGEAGFAASGSCLDTLPGTECAWIGLGGETGSNARVLATKDGGASWQAFETPFPSTASGGVFSIAFRDEDNGIIVGGDYQSPDTVEWTAATTSDGGESWTVSPVPPTGYRSSVRFLPGAKVPAAVAAGVNGVDISIDGGRTWTRLHDRGYHAIDFAGETGWAVGSEGRVARIDLHGSR